MNLVEIIKNTLRGFSRVCKYLICGIILILFISCIIYIAFYHKIPSIDFFIKLFDYLLLCLSRWLKFFFIHVLLFLFSFFIPVFACLDISAFLLNTASNLLAFLGFILLLIVLRFLRTYAYTYLLLAIALYIGYTILLCSWDFSLKNFWETLFFLMVTTYSWSTVCVHTIYYFCCWLYNNVPSYIYTFVFDLLPKFLWWLFFTVPSWIYWFLLDLLPKFLWWFIGGVLYHIYVFLFGMEPEFSLWELYYWSWYSFWVFLFNVLYYLAVIQALFIALHVNVFLFWLLVIIAISPNGISGIYNGIIFNFLKIISDPWFGLQLVFWVLVFILSCVLGRYEIKKKDPRDRSAPHMRFYALMYATSIAAIILTLNGN